MDNDYCIFCAYELSAHKQNKIKKLFQFAVLDKYDCICGFTDDEAIGQKWTLAPIAEVDEKPYNYNIMLFHVRDALLPQITELFRYSIFGRNETDDTIIGFADTTRIGVMELLKIRDSFEKTFIIDLISGKSDNLTNTVRR